MSNWTAVVTNAGNALLSEWIAGTILNFDGATAGTGTVPIAGLLAQTALVNQKQTATVTGYTKVEKGIRLRVQITAPQTGYTLNQIGIWANRNGGVSVLLALFQNGTGVPIPSRGDSPDFVYTFYGIITMDNAGSFTVSIDTSALVSQEAMTQAIDTAVAAKQDTIKAQGILKGDGTGGITSARPGDDYGLPLAAGAGTPTDTTQGVAGQHYYDSATDQEYVCTGRDASGKYHWKLAGISDTSDLTYNGQPLNTTLGSVERAVEDLQTGKADLDPTTHKVKAEQLPPLNYDPAGSAAAVQINLNTHTASRNNPHGVTAAQAGAVPTTRKVNNKPLSGDVSLTAADVGAVPTAGGAMTGSLTIGSMKISWNNTAKALEFEVLP